MDFGLARNATSSMTHDGVLLGTPHYMSPEQIRGDALDGRSDLFSLGVVLYELLTGEKPFSGDSVSSVLYRVVHEPPRPASLQLDRVPPSLAAFLHRALAKKPDDRFRDGTAFARALLRAGDESRATSFHSPVPGVPTPPADDVPAVPAGRAPRWPWILGGSVALAAIAAAAVGFAGRSVTPRGVMLQATVRSEPPGGTVLLNGSPAGSTVTFPAEGPFGVLSTVQGCREVKHRLDAADAGREIVLAVDPLTADVQVDPGVPGARVAVNGRDAGAAPVAVTLDLCRDNAIEVTADTFRPAAVSVAAKATPLQARTAIAGLKLEPVPMGRLRFPQARIPLVYTIDGAAVARGARSVEVPAGRHTVRATNAERFVDVEAAVDVPESGEATAGVALPALGRIVVQTFPPNCRVALRREGSDWRDAGESPLRYELAAGRYAVKVESPIDGQTREQELHVRSGANPPVRISFGRPDR
jgi:hypothetical protein